MGNVNSNGNVHGEEGSAKGVKKMEVHDRVDSESAQFAIENDPPPTLDVQPPSLTLDTIRTSAARLAASEALDKTTALALMNLFHAMENLLTYECNLRDRMIIETRTTLERTRLEGELDRLARRHTLDEQSLQQLAETHMPHTRGSTRRR